MDWPVVTDIRTIDDMSPLTRAPGNASRNMPKNMASPTSITSPKTDYRCLPGRHDLAVQGGAKLVVCPGFLVREAIYEPGSVS